MNAFAGTGQLGGGISFPPLTPVVKWSLIVLGGVFLLQWLIGLGAPQVNDALVTWLGLDHGTWFHRAPWAPVWQLVTYGLLHDGFGHVLWNCLFLYFFGTMVEGIVGSRRFAGFLVLGLLAGAVASLAMMQVVGARVPTIGASGAVAAVVLAAATFQPRATVLFIFIPVPLWLLAAVVVARDLFPAIEILVRGDPVRVDHFAHLGGALLGFLAVKRRFIWIDWKERVDAAVEDRRERAAAADEEELDRLLARVGREGLGSLTQRERDFLKRMSERKASKGR